MTKTFWLSFCAGEEKPEGQRFLGVCIVDVTEADATDALALIDEMFPQYADDAEWIAAASRKAHRLGINPGGQMLSLDITETQHNAPVPLVKDRLLSRPELEALGLEPVSQEELHAEA